MPSRRVGPFQKQQYTVCISIPTGQSHPHLERRGPEASFEKDFFNLILSRHPPPPDVNNLGGFWT
jgi:hypothetical protein